MTEADSAAPVITNWRCRQLSVSETASELALLLSSPTPQRISLSGSITGPFCSYTATLPADFQWRPMDLPQADRCLAAYRAEAIDPCLWEPLHPFLYRGTWGIRGTRIEQPIEFGWRSLAIRQGKLFLNGRPFRFRGIHSKAIDEETLRKLHANSFNLLHGSALVDWNLTDRFGPFVTATLPVDFDAASRAVADAGPLHPSVGVWAAKRSLEPQQWERLRKIDPATLFAQWIIEGKDSTETSADLRLIVGSAESLAKVGRADSAPWVAFILCAGESDIEPASALEELAKKWDAETAEWPSCLGWCLYGDDRPVIAAD